MSEDLLQRLAELKTRYLSRLAETRAELASGPPHDRLVFLAHNLAGSGATYGFPAISDHALALETALHAGEPADDHLRHLLTAVDIALSSPPLRSGGGGSPREAGGL